MKTPTAPPTKSSADRERVIDGLATSGNASDARALGKIVQRLSERWFVVRNAHAQGPPLLRAVSE